MSDATASIAYRFAASANPSFAAIRTYDLQFDFWNQPRRLSCFDRSIQPHHTFETEEPLDFLDPWYGHFGINSVDTVKLFRPGNLVTGRIPPPVADSCQPLCFCKFFLFSSQVNLSPLPRRHITKQQSDQKCFDKQDCQKAQEFSNCMAPRRVFPIANFGSLRNLSCGNSPPVQLRQSTT